MTSPSPAPLTEAEKAAARALAGDFECTWHIGCDEECHADRARAVVAAVKPLIAQELAESAESAEVIYRFAESRPITSTEARAIFDGIAASLSLPASKETP